MADFVYNVEYGMDLYEIYYVDERYAKRNEGGLWKGEMFYIWGRVCIMGIVIHTRVAYGVEIRLLKNVFLQQKKLYY